MELFLPIAHMDVNVVLILLWGCLFGTPSRADEPLVVVPDTKQVDIRMDFAGTDVKAVGAMDGPGDVIIKMMAPQQEATLSREIKLGPFWIGGDKVKAAGAPGLLFIYANRPIEAILAPAEREKYGLLLEGVPVRIEPQLQPGASDEWRKAFFRLKERESYYHEDDRAVKLFGSLFTLAAMVLGLVLNAIPYRARRDARH